MNPDNLDALFQSHHRLRVGIWEKIKDWFCGTNTSEALEKIYELTP
ncbi:hypothetical protein [Candidatus Arsenophonus triatominarum]|nr:hypothetical protein [Candidatus Arsenophonus triatominarum]